jgi:hypothetical protein
VSKAALVSFAAGRFRSGMKNLEKVEAAKKPPNLVL